MHYKVIVSVQFHKTSARHWQRKLFREWTTFSKYIHNVYIIYCIFLMWCILWVKIQMGIVPNYWYNMIILILLILQLLFSISPNNWLVAPSVAHLWHNGYDSVLYILYIIYIEFFVYISQMGWSNSRLSVSRAGRSGNPNLVGSNLDPAGSTPGWVKPINLKLILAAS